MKAVEGKKAQSFLEVWSCEDLFFRLATGYRAAVVFILALK